MTNRNNDKNLFITEISEADFRKLDIVAYQRDLYGWQAIKMNDVLDRNIQYLFESGYEEDAKRLSYPFTFAIHKANAEDPEDFYLDKFMNRFTGAQTYQFGFGIEHLYSTRDYYEAHDDYWRVFKRETKAIYRVHLDKKWLKMFKLKHRIEKMPWNMAYNSGSDSEDWELWIYYDFDKAKNDWVESHREKVVIDHEYKTHFHIPVNIDGEEIKHN